MWNEDSVARLQGCFDCTNWDVFRDSCYSLDELTDVVTSYVSFCVDTVIPVKKSKVFPNNKPWVSKHLKKVLNEKKRVYFLGDLAERKEVQRAVKSEIRKARENYKQKIELKFKTGDMRTVWDGIKTMSDMKQNGYNSKRLSPLGGKDDGAFAEDMNSFYSRFDNYDFRSVIDDIISSTKTDCNLHIDEKDVLRVFQCTNVRKSPGPDGISGQVLKNGATQLSGIFHSIFQASLSLYKVPTLWKTSIVVPVPKKSRPASPNDFRPVALTSHVMKSFEKIIKTMIMTRTDHLLDPLQFAYRPGRGVEDAVATLINYVLCHLEDAKTHARVLYLDMSSAFNTLQPHLLFKKLISEFKLESELALWVLDFLVGRPRQVRVNNTTSSVKVVSTGSPQGCVLSPLLFILYTNDCRSIRPNRYFIKFSDDTALLSLLSNDEVGHGPVLNDFVAWCDRSYLCLNATKTKDMCIDFRKYPPSQSDTVIHDNKVEVVDEYKYLGTTIDNKLKWDRHCSVTYKKCQQRLYCLRKLRSFNIDNTILSMFYKSCIQSVLTFSFICWFGNVSQKDKNKLQRVVNISSKITGLKQTSVTALYEKQVLRKANKIINDSTHILYNEYVLLPSSRRFRTITFKTNRKRDSFIPMSVRLLNSKR